VTSPAGRRSGARAREETTAGAFRDWRFIAVGRKRCALNRSSIFNPVTKELINIYANCLTDSDEDLRRKFVAVVLAADPSVSWSVAERLVDRLAGDDEAVGQRAAASLAAMGGAATGPIILRLHKARGKVQPNRLVEVLFRAQETEKEKGAQG
jgi:hypothetical protein